MPAVRTITRAVGNRVSVRVPEDYGACSLEVIILPLSDSDAGQWEAFHIEDGDGKARANKELMELAGSWTTDPETEKALADMRTIDWEMWK